jgi:hypothetical protein
MGLFNWYDLSSPPQIPRAPGVQLETKGLTYKQQNYVCCKYVSPPDSSRTPGAFYTYSYTHAYRLRLEKLLYLELSRSSSGYF